MAEKQLIVVVEGTAAMGPYWQSIMDDYLEKIIRSLCGHDMASQKYTANVELSLLVFNAHGPYSACLVQRSGCTKDMDIFFGWLSSIPFTGGGFSDVAIADGLAEALMMFSECHTQPSTNGQKHCILIAASNPYPLPTPVFLPPAESIEQKDGSDMQPEGCFTDAETVAKSFSQCRVSLSVISPKQLPKLRAIYNAGKYFSRATDSTADNVKHPQFLVLLSENFPEARAALCHIVSPTSGPPCSPVNGSVLNRQSIPIGNISTTAKDTSVVSSVVTGAGFSPTQNHLSSQVVTSFQASLSPVTSQSVLSSGDGVQEFKSSVGGLAPPVRPAGPAANVNILNNLSQARQAMSSSPLSGASSLGLQSMTGTSMAIHMSNMISSGMTSSPVPATQPVFSTGQANASSNSGSVTLAVASHVQQNPSLGSFSSTSSNIPDNASLGVQFSAATNIQGVGQTIHGMNQSVSSLMQSIPGVNQGNLSSGAQMGQNGISMNQALLNGLGPAGMSSETGVMVPASGVPHTVQSGLQPLVPTSGMPHPAQTGLHHPNVSNISNANMSLPHQSGAVQSQSKYLKVWEGALSGRREGQPVFICNLEGYRNATASEVIAADWPQTMHIVRLIPQEHMTNKQYVGKADFLVFRALNQHGFITQLQEKKLCAVIQLPSQTLLLSVSDKASRLIGMLFPGDMVVFKPQMPSQQQKQLHLQQQQQQIQIQQQQQQLQLQQQQQQQHMVGMGMSQQFVQSSSRGSIMSQGQGPSQGLPNMPGGGFLS